MLNDKTSEAIADILAVLSPLTRAERDHVMLTVDVALSTDPIASTPTPTPKHKRIARRRRADDAQLVQHDEAAHRSGSLDALVLDAVRKRQCTMAEIIVRTGRSYPHDAVKRLLANGKLKAVGKRGARGRTYRLA